MDQPVQYGVCSGGVSLKHIVPVGHRKLADDDGGFPSVPVFDDFHHVEELLSVKHFHSEVVQYQEVCLRDSGEKLVLRARDACEGGVVQQLVHVVVRGPDSVGAGLVSEGCCQPALPRSCRPGDQDGHPVPDVVAGGQVHELGLVHAPLPVADDLLDGGAVSEARLLEKSCVPALPPVVEFCLYEELQPLPQGEGVRLPGLLQGRPVCRHSGHLERSECVFYFSHCKVFLVFVDFTFGVLCKMGFASDVLVSGRRRDLSFGHAGASALDKGLHEAVAVPSDRQGCLAGLPEDHGVAFPLEAQQRVAAPVVRFRGHLRRVEDVADESAEFVERLSALFYVVARTSVPVRQGAAGQMLPGQCVGALPHVPPVRCH